MLKRQIPNILSVLRILMIPLFIWLFFKGGAYIYHALAVYLLAGVTDAADGWLARRNGWITRFGKLLDPAADKLMQLTVLICFTVKGMVDLWILLLFAVKELFMMAGALFVLKKYHYTVKANWYGKASAAVFYIAIVLSILLNSYITGGVRLAMFAVALAAAAASMILYIMDTVKIRNSTSKKNISQV